MGAVCYLDPKRQRNPKYDLKMASDIYSLGVIFWQISSGREPFKGEANDEHKQKLLFSQIANGRREKPIAKTPTRYIYLFQDCWDSEPKARPNIFQVVNTLNEIQKVIEEFDPVENGTI